MTSKLRIPLLAALCVGAHASHAQAKQLPAESTADPEEPAAGAAQEENSGEEGAAAKFLDGMKWTVGPGKAAIGSVAEIQVPEGTRFTGPEGTRLLLEAMRNPTDGSELGLLTNEALDWFVIFVFEDIGYVKDADKEKLDADEILESLRKANEYGNQERKKRGWPPITVVGWHTPPFYNKETNNLEWCIKGESQGHAIVNYNTRILGRGGVMSANLLVPPDQLDTTLPNIKKVLQGFSYAQGQKYSEWKSGDKVAKYGLTALVVGGAAGVAAKMGLFAKLAASLGKLWKVIILGVIGVLAFLRALIFGKKKAPPEDHTQPLPEHSTQPLPEDDKHTSPKDKPE
ncbi:MAG: DUF2167 domain-containing protein [Deltaproteobacteria bacterium]|nr:DUF2167 domain-containing protein [Deltaproteobacteria bacterium]